MGAGAGAGPVLRGLVLAGGRSERMGRDKAALVIGTRTLLEDTVDLVKPFVASVKVAVRPDQVDEPLRRRFDLLSDPPGLAGPGAALVAAWRHAPDAAWLVVACDMPGLTPEVLAALVAARDPHRGGTAWRGPHAGAPEPLCAIWEPVTLARLAAVPGPDAGRASPRALLAAANPVLLHPARPAVLTSVNTPADLDSYLEQLHGQEP